jgi:hypothetical protein
LSPQLVPRTTDAPIEGAELEEEDDLEETGNLEEECELDEEDELEEEVELELEEEDTPQGEDTPHTEDELEEETGSDRGDEQLVEEDDVGVKVSRVWVWRRRVGVTDAVLESSLLPSTSVFPGLLRLLLLCRGVNLLAVGTPRCRGPTHLCLRRLPIAMNTVLAFSCLPHAHAKPTRLPSMSVWGVRFLRLYPLQTGSPSTRCMSPAVCLLSSIAGFWAHCLAML